MQDIVLLVINYVFVFVGIAGLLTAAYETLFGKHTGRHRYSGLLESRKRSRH